LKIRWCGHTVLGGLSVARGARRPACVTRVWAYLWHDLWAYVELIADLVILGCASLCDVCVVVVRGLGACGGGPGPPCGEFTVF
jgi:hypothetical protein